jgi:hypothetical protein
LDINWCQRGLWHKEVVELAFGENFKATMSLPADSWSMGLGGFGEMLPYYENKGVYIDHTKRQMGTTVLLLIAATRE